ncbi:hypothetical protein J7337_013944 [Fusarium musae]|uniref:Uncharacterized protein n=1 Tax=Fusarium musae TaxID=1042133 RepID=A0A9P8D3R7_9HYPO|nr:hypothetical protein J7337_013944 [Fusarium musae]KAG9494805.1 hypothetical protein J7337_013944 [Fusarium musae]
MDKKARIRRQLRSCAEQMQQLLEQLNPNHNISQSLKVSISQIRHFNEFDQPNVLSLWQDLLHEPRALPFRVEQFSRQEQQSKSLLDRRAERSLGIPIFLVDAGNNREQGLPGVQKKVEVHDIMDEFHDAPLKLKVMGKRKTDDADELIQPDNERKGGLLGDKKKLNDRNIIDKRHRPATK